MAGEERFSKVVNEDRLAELEALRDFLQTTMQARYLFQSPMQLLANRVEVKWN